MCDYFKRTLGAFPAPRSLVATAFLGENVCHTEAVVALALGRSDAEGSLKDYVVSGSKDCTIGVFQVADGALTFNHKYGEGVPI